MKKTNLKIITETPDYLVVHKPAGLIVHGGPNISDSSLSDLLLANFPKIKNVGDDPLRPGLVHRLDKEVSGLMVVAKNNKSFINLKEQFKKRKIEKEYLALVYGKISKDEGKIDFPIRRASSGHKMAALPITSKGLIDKERLSDRDQGTNKALLGSREALSYFFIEKRFINYSLLRVIIKTGRTHQIRVHLSAYGHPLVGDNLYSTKKTREKNKKLALGRIFLIANKLSFTDLHGQKQSFSTTLDKELEQFLETIK